MREATGKCHRQNRYQKEMARLSHHFWRTVATEGGGRLYSNINGQAHAWCRRLTLGISDPSRESQAETAALSRGSLHPVCWTFYAAQPLERCRCQSRPMAPRKMHTANARLVIRICKGGSDERNPRTATGSRSSAATATACLTGE